MHFMAGLREQIRNDSVCLSATQIGEVQTYQNASEASIGIKKFYETIWQQTEKGAFGQRFRIASQPTADLEFRVHNAKVVRSLFSRAEYALTTLVLISQNPADKAFLDAFKYQLRRDGVPVKSVTGDYLRNDGLPSKNSIESEGEPFYLPPAALQSQVASVPAPVVPTLPEIQIAKKELVGKTLTDDIHLVVPLFGRCEVVLTDSVLEKDLIIEDLEVTIQAAKNAGHFTNASSPFGTFNYPQAASKGWMSCTAYGRIEGAMHKLREGHYLAGVEVIIKGGKIKGAIKFVNCHGYLRLEDGASVDTTKLYNGTIRLK